MIVIVQARMGSTRLPGKVLLPLNGHTVVGEVLTRCKSITDRVICAVPDDFSNDVLAAEASKYAEVVRGPERDVLKRYRLAAEHAKATEVMRITADCPLISPALCKQVAAALEGNDYASNVEPRTFPQGFDCEAFTMAALREADDKSEEREHVTTYIRNGPFRRVNVASPWKLDGRVTLDTEDDYRVICRSFGHAPYQRLRAA